MVSWEVPKIWPGQTVAVLGSGPSMAPAVAAACRAVPCIAVNDTVLLAPWAAMLYAADEEWWTKHPRDEVRRAVSLFAGLRVGATLQPVKGVMRLRVSYAPRGDAHCGFDPDPGAVRTGGNSGYQAVHVAAHAGAARILLCGFDMGGLHWHDEHALPLRTTIPETYPRWIARFAELAKVLEARGIDVVNCTPGSALTCFRFMDLEAALAEGPQRTAA